MIGFLSTKISWNDTTKFPYKYFWWEAPDGLRETFELMGIGDSGGGVTRTHLNNSFAMKNDPLAPKIVFITAEDYFKHLHELSKKVNFPFYKNELYLEYHRGTYTTQATTKRNNRFAETALANSEIFSSIATIMEKLFMVTPQ